MTDESLQLLWRGGDLAKFAALQAALREEGINFWDAPIYDPAGGFLQSRPYYLEATSGFEIRVLADDLGRAKSALEWVERKEGDVSPVGDLSLRDQGPFELKPLLPYNWDSKEATSEVWSGEDELMADYLASVLRENGIPSRIPDEPDCRVRVYVRAVDLMRARSLVREIAGNDENDV
jgi:hypothetical protein